MARTRSSPFRLDPDGLGLGPAGLEVPLLKGMVGTGSKFPSSLSCFLAGSWWFMVTAF